MKKDNSSFCGTYHLVIEDKFAKEMDRYTANMWFIYGPKHREDNLSQHMMHPCGMSQSGM